MSSAARIWRCFSQQGRTTPAPDTDLLGRIALVTGGAGGIGLETSIGLASRGASVLVASRRATGSAAQDALTKIRAAAFDSSQEVVPFAVDLAEVPSVVQCSGQVGQWLNGRSLDILVCNSGIMGGGKLVANSQGVEKTWAVNVLGHAALFWELQEALKKSSSPRVVFVSAELHIFADDPVGASNVTASLYGKNKAYFNSKAANILFAREVHKRNPSVTSIALHPGVIDTDFGKDSCFVDSRAFRRTRYLSSSL